MITPTFKKSTFAKRVAALVTTHRLVLLSFIFFFAFSFAVSVFATPPASPYTPGATLDPACVPGSSNCTVTPVSIGATVGNNSTAGSVLYVDGSNTLAQDNTNFLYTAGGSLKLSTSLTAPLLLGGTLSGGNLTLSSTSNATKGNILFGTSAYDEVNNRLGIGTTTPGTSLEVVGTIISKGTSWVSRTSAAAVQWAAITYGNGLFVAVAGNGTTSNNIMTSPDGITWTSRTSPAANSWASITYGNGLFVAVSGTGSISNQVMTSPDGITWTSRTIPVANPWSSVTYGNGLFVAVSNGTLSDAVMTSPDGITWTSRTIPAAHSWSGVTYGNGLFVAVSTDGTTADDIMTSLDGITWTSRTSPAANRWFSVTYGNGLFVAVDLDGATMTSPNGITWTSRTSASAARWRSVTYGNGLFVAVADAGAVNTRIMTSPDGITWVNRPGPANNGWEGVVYGNGIFVSVSYNGTTANNVMTSGSPDYSAVQNNNIFQGGFYSLGNVGIGTTSATAPLTIKGAGATNATYGVSVSNSATEYARFYDDKRFAIQGKIFIDAYNTPGTWTDLNNTQAKGLSVQTLTDSTSQNGQMFYNEHAGTTTANFQGFRVLQYDTSSTAASQSVAALIENSFISSVNRATFDGLSVRLGSDAIASNTTITDAKIISSTLSGAGVRATNTITNTYGYYTDGITGAGSMTNYYGLYVGSSSATTKYGVYVSDAAMKNYFAGNTSIGAPTSSLLRFVVADGQALGYTTYIVNTSTGSNAGVLQLGLGNTTANTPNTNRFIQFLNSSTASSTGVSIGSITGDGAGGITYGNVSDARIKENIAPATTGLDALMNIHVKNFNYIGSPVNVQGFIAQDLYAVYPYAVITNGDNGTDPLAPGQSPWMVDYGRVTPLIVQSIQDLNIKLTGVASLDLTNASSVASLVTDFFAHQAILIHDLTVGTLHIGGDVCVDDVCVTKEQFKNLLLQAQAGSVSSQQPLGSGGSLAPDPTPDSGSDQGSVVTPLADDQTPPDSGDTQLPAAPEDPSGN